MPGPENLEALRAELSARFEPDDVEFLLQATREQWQAHSLVTYLDLGTADAEAEAAYARNCAEWLGWKFEHLHGNPALLRDLLWGVWDDQRFQIIEPGQQLVQSTDESVMRADPAPEKLAAA